MEKRLGNIYGEDRGTGFAGNVWDTNAVSPTLTTMQGGGRQPMIIDAQAIRMVRTEEGKKLRKQYESHEIEHGFNEHREMELRTDGVSNTLSTVQKDNYICETRVDAVSTNGTDLSGCIRATYYKNGERNIVENVMNKKGYEGVVEKTIVAMRGRNPENPSDRTVGAPTEQRLEPNSQGICNTITSVQKDNLVMENRYRVRKMTEEEYQKAMDAYYRTRIRIRKLTPKECWRLMDFSDEDFHKAESVNSNTQLYKQSGNSICRGVLMAIFSQMNIVNVPVWNELTEDGRSELIDRKAFP